MTTLRADIEELFDEMLNESYGTVQIGDLTFDPAYVLKMCDPMAYQIGLNEYRDELEEEEEEEEYEEEEEEEE